jgi:hypothetical protein
MVLLPPAPQAGASASSATSARQGETVRLTAFAKASARQEAGRYVLREHYFAGAGGGVVGVAEGASAGAVDVGTGGAMGLEAADGAGAGVPLTTDPDPRCPMMDSASANSMNSTAATEVALVSSVAPERAPNAAWLLLPPNALAISPPRPCCSRITNDKIKQTSTYRLIRT